MRDEAKDLPFLFEGRREDQISILQGGRELRPFFLSVRSLSCFEKVEEIVRIFCPDLERKRSYIIDWER